MKTLSTQHAWLTIIIAFSISCQFVALPANALETPKEFRARKINTGHPYRHVFSSKGISCNVDGERDISRPTLGNSGHFSCPCLTDMGCVMVNPHINEDTGQMDLSRVARAPKGSSCFNPISWEDAKHNIGSTLVVVGPVADTKSAVNAPGKPTWINVGGRFPNPNRLQLVAWDDSKNSLIVSKTQALEGKHICVVGKITNYRGSPQIELRSAKEIRLLN